jgi:hypothetical protein
MRYATLLIVDILSSNVLRCVVCVTFVHTLVEPMGCHGDCEARQCQPQSRSNTMVH